MVIPAANYTFTINTAAKFLIQISKVLTILCISYNKISKEVEQTNGKRCTDIFTYLLFCYAYLQTFCSLVYSGDSCNYKYIDRLVF